MNESNVCHHDRKKCVAIVPIFNHLTEEEMQEIVHTTTSMTYEKGEILYNAGYHSEGLYIVHKGKVKTYRLSETGKEQLIRVLNPGDFVGELSLFSTMIHDSYAEAMEKTEVCRIRREDLQQFLLKYPEISLKVLTEFSNRLSETEKQATSIATESVNNRIVTYIGTLIKNTNDSIVSLPMSRKDIASYLGTSPETISRNLTELEKEGFIEQLTQRKLKIINDEPFTQYY